MTQYARQAKVRDACTVVAIDQDIALRIVLLAYIETLNESNLHFSGRRARTASHEGILVHERHLPTVEAGLSHHARLALGEDAYQFQSIGLGTRSNKIHDGTVFHPIRNHHQGMRRFCRAHQWQQVRVFELLPQHHFAAEVLFDPR